MALQQAIDRETGDSYPEAYHKIVSLTFTFPGVVDINLYVFRDLAARNARKTPVCQPSFLVIGPDFDTYFATAVLDMPRSNPVKKGYQYLKTLPEYAGALDV